MEFKVFLSKHYLYKYFFWENITLGFSANVIPELLMMLFIILANRINGTFWTFGYRTTDFSSQK